MYSLKTLVSLLLLAIVAASPAIAQADITQKDKNVRVGHSLLSIPCGHLGRRVPAIWYYPKPELGEPVGLVWVQHGFLRNAHNVAELARSLAESTGAIVVTPTLSSNALALEGCWLNGEPLQAATAKLFTEGKALAKSARMAGFRGGTLPAKFVLSGHSAGGNFALSAAGFTAAPNGALARLSAVILYDGVDYRGQMTTALARLTNKDYRPVLQIAAPPSSCNNMGAGTRALVAARPNIFVGVELLRGSHLDAEGGNSGIAADLVCGRPRPENVEALRQIAGDWVGNALTGSSHGIVGGAPGEQIPVGDATAVVLPVW